MITRTYKAKTQAKAAQKMQAEGGPSGHILAGQSWAPGGRSCAAQGFVVLGILFLIAGIFAFPLLILAAICLVIGLVSGRANGELTVTWVPEPIPPQVQSAPAAQPPPAPTSIEARLAAVERLRESGMLTDEEYAAKRAAILAEV
jgi:hypothetical protein